MGTGERDGTKRILQSLYPKQIREVDDQTLDPLEQLTILNIEDQPGFLQRFIMILRSKDLWVYVLLDDYNTFNTSYDQFSPGGEIAVGGQQSIHTKLVYYDPANDFYHIQFAPPTPIYFTTLLKIIIYNADAVNTQDTDYYAVYYQLVK